MSLCFYGSIAFSLIGTLFVDFHSEISQFQTKGIFRSIIPQIWNLISIRPRANRYDLNYVDHKIYSGITHKCIIVIINA